MPGELPWIDEHDVVVAAPADRVWEALAAVVPAGVSGRAAPPIARALCCASTRAAGPVTSAGSTIPGFRVERADRPRELLLRGAHRFSRYDLAFRITALPDGRSRVLAETRATFRGAAGRAYRALVTALAGALVVLRVLRAAKRRAERP